MIRYEHPLNERIRTLMRLEDVHARARVYVAGDLPQDHHAALASLFEMADIAARADLKTELLQELERQRQQLVPLRANPRIETEALDALLAEIDAVNAQLLAPSGKLGARCGSTARHAIADRATKHIDASRITGRNWFPSDRTRDRSSVGGV